jgi:hypothetical protein
LSSHRLCSVGVALVCLTLAGNASGQDQVDDRLEAYTGRNAAGYLAPLVDAFRSNLNSGLFHTAYIPVRGFHAGLEFNAMSTFFGEDSRSFVATTEGGFQPEMQARAPTVVGDVNAVVVTGAASTQYAFPGGFNVDNMYFTCPQITVGAWKGTEALGRLILFDTGISELGRLSVWGGGIRHSLSQYAASLHPLDLAIAGYWQVAGLRNDDGQEVIDARLATISMQSGAQLGPIYPYAGLSVNWWKMDVRYRFDEPGFEPVELDFTSDAELQMTLGASYRVGFVAAYGEYNFARENTVAVGFSMNFPFNDRSVPR